MKVSQLWLVGALIEASTGLSRCDEIQLAITGQVQELRRCPLSDAAIGLRCDEFDGSEKCASTRCGSPYC